MDEVGGVVVDGVEGVLIPHVVEIVVDFAGLLEGALRVRTAIAVEDQCALGTQRRVGPLEVAEQFVSLAEQEEREVERHRHVDEFVADVANVALDQLDASRLFRMERSDVVLATPLERVWIEVDPPGVVVIVGLDPTAREQRGSTEILA